MADIILTEKDIARFWSKTRRNPETGCLEWTGCTYRGYGVFQVCGHARRAHRVAWTLYNGPIPPGVLVCHRCDNRRCVDVDGGHLFLGSQADNIADMVAKNRQAWGDKNGARLHPERVARGERQGQAKLTEPGVREIRRLLATGLTQRTVAKLFGVSQRNVSLIFRREKWAHVV